MKRFLARNNKMRTVSICVLLLILTTLITALTVTASASGPRQIQTTPQPPTADPPPSSSWPEPLPTPTPGERDETRTNIVLGGPETKGIETTIAGKVIKLPDDAQLGGVVLTAEFARDQLPFIAIERGNSCIYLGLYTGKVVSGSVAQAEEKAFDFLKETFPTQAEAIDSLQVIASEKVSQ